MIDSHTHLASCRGDEEELVAAAREAGVRRMLTVGMDEDSNAAAIAAAERHEEVFACVGRHPNSAAGFGESMAAAVEELTAHPRVRAVGETGLDWYRDSAPRESQRAAFSAQIGIARRAGLPLVIHMRDSADDTFAQLAAEAEDVTVVLHCYSAGPDRVEAAARQGWFMSLAGNVTYPKAEELQEAARLIPDELLLVETDAPYLSPQPYRGKPNQPANVVATAEFVAGLRGASYGELEETVEANGERLFKW